ncbi:MAG: glycosyltransferase, partial [Rivularia sp. (in: cyanobacteria)]
MNVLHINQSDISGGAAIAGYRLHKALLAKDFNSHLLVGKTNISHPRITSVPRKHFLEKQLNRFTSSFGLKYINHISSFDIPKHIFYKNADIVNFHNLHLDYFNYLAIPSLTQNKPAVLTLHDMWSFTGHCAYSYDCERWKIGCGKCPYLNTYPAVARDNTSLEWKLKNWVYNHSNLSIVAPSNWLVEQAKQSMLKNLPIYHIPYGIDTQAYQPLNPEECRFVLGIPADKKVLMFGAQSLKDSRKGADLLVKALSKLPESLKAETILLTLGHGSESLAQTVGMECLSLGYVSSDRLKSIAFTAADLFVFPTRADNLPLFLQESMACGTP